MSSQEISPRSSEPQVYRGQVIRSQSGFYTVQLTEEQPRFASAQSLDRRDPVLLTCRLRGRLKRGPRQEDLVAIGDWVQVSPLGEEKGVIEAVETRQRVLSRLAPTPRGIYQQILIANPDQAVYVFACAQPAPRLGMLDRFLVIAEKQGLPALIVANKVDLLNMAHARALFGYYPALGYPVIYTSALNGLGIDELRESLANKLSVLAGPSGVGKSSLLNAVQPGLGLIAREISQATEKGRHTTVVRQMFPLEDGGYVADTPGLKALGLWDVEPEELDGYFPELRKLVAQCQFSDCTHLHEPGCAVRAALRSGDIHPERYQSYQRMRAGQEE